MNQYEDHTTRNKNSRSLHWLNYNGTTNMTKWLEAHRFQGKIEKNVCLSIQCGGHDGKAHDLCGKCVLLTLGKYTVYSFIEMIMLNSTLHKCRVSHIHSVTYLQDWRLRSALTLPSANGITFHFISIVNFKSVTVKQLQIPFSSIGEWLLSGQILGCIFPG